MFTPQDAIEIQKSVALQLDAKKATGMDVIACLCTMLATTMAMIEMPAEDFNVLVDELKAKYLKVLLGMPRK